MGLWLIAVRKLQCFSGRLKKLSVQDQRPYTALKLFASVPSLLQPHLSIGTKLPIYYEIRIDEPRGKKAQAAQKPTGEAREIDERRRRCALR